MEATLTDVFLALQETNEKLTTVIELLSDNTETTDEDTEQPTVEKKR